MIKVIKKQQEEKTADSFGLSWDCLGWNSWGQSKETTRWDLPLIPASLQQNVVNWRVDGRGMSCRIGEESSVVCQWETPPRRRPQPQARNQFVTREPAPPNAHCRRPLSPVKVMTHSTTRQSLTLAAPDFLFFFFIQQLTNQSRQPLD